MCEVEHKKNQTNYTFIYQIQQNVVPRHLLAPLRAVSYQFQPFQLLLARIMLVGVEVEVEVCCWLMLACCKFFI